MIRGFINIYPARSHLETQVVAVIAAWRTPLGLLQDGDVGVGVQELLKILTSTGSAHRLASSGRGARIMQQDDVGLGVKAEDP